MYLHGTGVSNGIAIGKAYVLQRDLPEVPEYAMPQEYVEEEVTRFQRAVEASRRQLMAIREHIPANAPPEASSFLDTHLLMLDDKMISRRRSTPSGRNSAMPNGRSRPRATS